MTGIEDAARAWYQAGACILPAAPDGTKKPGVGSWDQYKAARPSWATTEGWLGTSDGIGMVCGAVSGNIEMLELEGAAADLFPTFVQAITEADPEVTKALGTYLEKTPGGGYHFLYRVAGPVAGNTKLASRPREPTPDSPARRATLIETRGEGGWTVLAPSAGRTHPTGGAWTILAGAPGVIATITEAQRNLLHAVAASFDEMPPPVYTEPLPAGAGSPTYPGVGGTPGDDFNERVTWPEILEPAGWRRIYGRGEVTYWQRPGKNDRTISASTGHMGDWLYIFTTSTEFEPERTYTKFGAYAVINHNGDHSAAAGELRKRGYGKAPAPQLVERKLTLIRNDETPTTSGNAALKPAPVVVTTTYTDDGNAQLLVANLDGEMLYSPARTAWLQWDTKRWKWAESGSEAVEAMRKIIRSMAPIDEPGAKWKQGSLSKKRIYDAVKLASDDPILQVSMDDLDCDPYVLNTPAGVVSLTTGELHRPVPGDRHTKLTKCAPDFDKPAERWLRFLAETFEGDADMIGFVQRLIGYSAIGKVTHHVLPFLHGVGANGKSVFLEVAMGVLGDYAGPAPLDMLLATPREDPSSIANLAGQRLVVCSEVGQSARFNEAKVKLLTGGDQLRARFLYGNEFKFVPSHHLWLMGNNQPRVTTGGTSIWRRLRLVPFDHIVPESQRIVGLADQLVEQEGPSILAWIVNGARAQTGGLQEPSEVTLATSTYAEEEDQIGRFISEECVLEMSELQERVTTRYRMWCERNGERPISGQMFGRELKTRFSVDNSGKSNGRRVYKGIRLKRLDEEEPRAQQMDLDD